MEHRHMLNHGARAEPRFVEPKVRRLLLREDDPMEQLGVRGFAVPDGVLARAAETTTSAAGATNTCGANDSTGTCLKNVTNSTFTLPIALGIAIPLTGALLAFFFLHRRHVRKQRAEDANDPHKSLDFGLGDAARKQRAKRLGAEMAVNDIDLQEKPGRRGQQRSMDLDIVSPYLLPPELQNSRESLHSLSRTIHQQEDPYRPVSQFVASDTHSLRSYNRPRGDGSSVYTASSGAPSRLQESSSSADLLANAAGMPRSAPSTSFIPPPRQNSLPRLSPSTSPIEGQSNPLPLIPAGTMPPYPLDPPQIQVPPPTVLNIQRKGVPAGLPSNPRPGNERSLSSGLLAADTRESYMGSESTALRHSNNYLGAFIDARNPSPPPIAPPPPSKSPDRSAVQLPEEIPEVPRKSPPPMNSLPANPRPQRQQSLPENQQPYAPQPRQPPQLPQLPEPQEAWIDDDASDYGDGFEVTPPSPGQEQLRNQRYSMDVPPEEFANAGLGAPGFDPRRMSMGFRPLPPDTVNETDDPEIRANRIRSFYKEYFDDSRPQPAGQYYEDYDQNYLGDGAYYDPNGNNFVMPYAQPVTRRAMTPPPQSQRFMGQPPRGFHGSVGGFDGPQMAGPRPRGYSSASGMMPQPGPRAHSSASGRLPPPGPRSYSSASGRMGPPGGPRRPIPPPAALNTLPTPSKLRDDSFALMNSIDFAPPVSYKERQTGRSQSPMGERRPYSPAVPVYKPLASTYDELPSMPSPHLLRKSGTFTGLDFAPPRRIKDSDTMSDAGSIRSNRSGVSAVHQNAIRTGAYRVSRLPGDTIFSKDDMVNALKPSWKVGS